MGGVAVVWVALVGVVVGVGGAAVTSTHKSNASHQVVVPYDLIQQLVEVSRSLQSLLTPSASTRLNLLRGSTANHALTRGPNNNNNNDGTTTTTTTQQQQQQQQQTSLDSSSLVSLALRHHTLLQQRNEDLLTQNGRCTAQVEALQEDKAELRQQLQEYKKRLRNVQYARLAGKSTTTTTTNTDDRCHCEREGGNGGGGGGGNGGERKIVVEKLDESTTDILKCPCLGTITTTITPTIPTTTTTTTTTAAPTAAIGVDVVATTTTTTTTRPTTTTTTETPVLGGGARVKDCAGHQNEGATESGVYEIFPSECRAKKVWCDLETEGGGWTVFLQRRELPQQENFTRTWLDYERGFGEVVGEYWLGNEALHQLTAKAPHVLRVDAEDFLGSRRWGHWGRFRVASPQKKRWGHWGRFRVASPQKNYELLAVAYATNSTLGDGLLWHSGMKFSTIDRDNDNHKGSCADEYKGGWWYNVCHNANPTGILNNSENFDSVGWVYWTPRLYKWASLRNLQMKFRPSGFGATIPSSAPGDCTTTTTTTTSTTTPKTV